MLADSCWEVWSFLGPGSEKKWCGTYSDKPDGDWDQTAERMMLNFAEKRSPYISCHQRPGKRRTKSKEKGKKSIHFNDSEGTIELILRTIISVNQLSIYGAGAVADLCKEWSTDSEVAANEDLESMGIPTELPIADPHTNAELQGNLLQDYEQKFEQLPEDQKLSKLCCDAGLKLVEKGQFFITLDEEEGPLKWRIYVESTRYLEVK